MDDVFTTSYLRSNIIAWLPIHKNDDVLFVENGTVAILRKLREMSEHVTCIPVPELGTVQGKFDYIIVIGNLTESAESIAGNFRGGRPALAANCISYLKGLLKDEGNIILAVENRLGLKYWAGAKEEKSHRYFAGLGQNAGISGFTGKELREILKDTGSRGTFYYPFPDYRFAMNIYSDGYLPKSGELTDQVGNFDEERLTMFDEGMVGDTVIEENLFPLFSNSFLMVIGDSGVAPENEEQEEILYVKFSNDRSREHNIRTFITRSKDGRMHLIKKPDGDAAAPQIAGIEKAYAELSELFADSRFSVNRCKRRDDGLEPEYLTGRTLEEEADGLLEEGREEEAEGLILEVASELRKCKGQQSCRESEGFRRVFGRADLPEGLMAAPFSDIDAILPNILRRDAGEWTLIDYEWSFAFPIPINFIIYRMIHYYVDTTTKRQVLKSRDLYEKAGITQKERQAYGVMEDAFQDYIVSGHTPLRKLYVTRGKPVYHVKRVLNEIRETERKLALVFYFDRGGGFLEEDVRAYRCEALDGIYRIKTEIPEDVERLRIDPGNEAVTVDIRNLYWEGEPEGVVPFISNGHRMKENLYLFDTKDPNILLESLPKGKRILNVELKIETMSLEAAEWIAEKIDVKYRLKKLLKK